MDKILIINGSFHHKNKQGIENILNSLNYNYKYGNETDIINYNIIISPSKPINTSKYPKQKFIFGPHFSVFPNVHITRINNIHNNSIYIQPSDWVTTLWRNLGAETYIPIYTFCFPVNTNKFNRSKDIRKKVFIYFKRRNLKELKSVEKLLRNNNIEYTIFDYVKGYNENEYLHYLQESKYGIIIDAHESQGFAIEEALSCDVPLLVWNTKVMSQELGGNYPDIPCTSIPYWDNKCGEFFYNEEQLEKTFVEMTENLDKYHPREYILKTLGNEVCGNKFKDLIQNLA